MFITYMYKQHTTQDFDIYHLRVHTHTVSSKIKMSTQPENLVTRESIKKLYIISQVGHDRNMILSEYVQRLD